MQQSQAVPYFYQTGPYNQEGGGPATHAWQQLDNPKNNQYTHPWENNAGYPLTGGNQYGGQVQGGGGQNRQVPPQPQTPQQPPPTSNTPPGIHGGEMSKQQLMQNQTAQLNYVPNVRLPTQGYGYRSSMTQQQMRPPRPMSLYQVQNVLTQAPSPPAIAQVLQYPVMYGPQPRQNGPYQSSQQFIMQQQFYNSQQVQSTPPFYPAVQISPFPSISSGGPSPQTGGQGTVPIAMRQPMVPNTSMAPPPSKQEPKKRPNAIKIMNPETGTEVVVDSENNSNNNNITPTRSNDSSARETPQPVSGVVPDNAVAANFAAMVAAVAVEPVQQPPEQPRPPEHIPQSDSDHKQSSAVPTSEKSYPISNLSMASEEFIPRSHKQQLSEPVVEEEQHVPTVSAETNSPAIELQRSKEFPTLSKPPSVQSPARGNAKKKVNEPVAVPQPLPTDSKDATKKPVRGGGSVKEELPKEKREKTRSVSKEQSPAPSPVVSVENVSSQSETSAVVKSVPSAPVKEPAKNNSLPPPLVEESANSKTLQHQNGEAASDGSKTARQKTKSKKMRDQLNRKVDKEGSDMDAFMDTSIVSEEKDRPMTPASPPLPAPATIEAPSAHEEKIKEDLEEKEDKQEKLVAAKNEENAKVSMSHEAKAETPVIEKVEEKKPPQLVLRHSYRKDQWSPLNPDGKRKYDREFLFGLKTEPQSNLKPDNLPDVVAVIRDSSMLMRNNPSMNYMNNRGGGLLPDFIQRSTQSQRGPLPKGRGSTGGKKSQNPKVIHMSLSLHEDVKLKTAENAWKPNRLESDAGKNEEEKETEKLYKEVRGILNKLTPQKFDTLMKKFMQLPINSEERLIGVINHIFDKAVDEPNFSKAYANMCKICSRMEVAKMENGQEQKVNFRKILITRCQTEFESNKSSELDAAKWLEEIKNCTDPEQKKELQLQYEEKERTIRRKSVGNIRFIGELFKLGMLTPAIMYRCIEHLLSTPEEESLECLCKLLTTIGKDLEFGTQQQKPPSQGSLHQYFQRMAELAQKREGSKVSSRVRFMLQDVIELRQNKWVPRREDNNPKTIEQITKEAERESIEMSMALQQPPRMNRQNDRPDDRKRNNRGGNNQSDSDGWVNVTQSRYHSKAPAFEASKMQNMVKNEMTADLNSLSLGGRSQFIFSTTSKSMENKTTGPGGFLSNNVYSALQQEKKPPPQPSMNSSRRLTPTPSIEKDRERQRMIQGALESDGRNSRGSSMQRERPAPMSSQPASRESSIPRQPDNKETERRDDKQDETARRAAMEKLERQTNTIFDEYLAVLTTVEDVKQDVESIFDEEEKIGSFISRGLELALEKKAGTQKRIGELFTALMDYNVVSTDVFVEQLCLIYEASEDMAIDVPKVWDLQAQVIVPILAAEKINFSHIKAACSPVLQTKPAVKLLVPILTLLAQEKMPGFVRKVWDSSDVSLKDFLPPDTSVDAFIKENSLEYLTGAPPQYTCQLSMDEIQDKMIRLMQTNMPCDKIFQFISSNVGDKVDSLQFIRALITAICTACITGSNNLDLVRFKEYEKLIQRYVDNKEDRELACLSSVHILSNKLDHPQGLIMNIFNQFLDNHLISSESFLKWKEDDTEKLENKGVSVLSLTSFFMSLGEVESEDENS